MREEMSAADRWGRVRPAPRRVLDYRRVALQGHRPRVAGAAACGRARVGRRPGGSVGRGAAPVGTAWCPPPPTGGGGPRARRRRCPCPWAGPARAWLASCSCQSGSPGPTPRPPDRGWAARGEGGGGCGRHDCHRGAVRRGARGRGAPSGGGRPTDVPARGRPPHPPARPPGRAVRSAELISVAGYRENHNSRQN